NLGDLKGRLTVASGSAYLSTLKSARSNQFPDLDWAISTDQSPKALLEAVADGKLDYTIGDSVTIALLQRIYPQLAVAFDVTDEEPVTWYVRHSDDDSLNAAMLDFFNGMGEEGAMARLEEKYLGHVGTFDYVDTRTFLRAIDNTLPDIKPLFEKYATSIDWRLLAAISYQESHWNPQATSPTGVRGMMMLTRNTADSLDVGDRTDPEQSIRGGSQYLQDMMAKVPQTIPEDERIWFALAAYNMGYAHMLDVRKLTARQGGNPDSWADVKLRLPMLSQKRYYTQTAYGYARGHEAYNYVENIRKYQISLVGYLQEQERRLAQQAEAQAELAKGYPAVEPKIAMN
ncbi:membrane-bound lytic murein transglycosylase MltF, partial [Pantoea vagans]|uniref:membrane-bound lytic murein transglycosylase MltF n=1 Tax=Pantoea vagans TaxID=470934 RepID=UPI00289E6C21